MTPEQLAKSGSEHAHQRALFARIAQYNNSTYSTTGREVWEKRKAQLKWLYAIPNGGQRHGAVAGKMKAEGTKKGVWDLFLPVPARKSEHNAYYHGLYIELKTPDRRNDAYGGLTDEQVEFGNFVHANGYATAVCYTWEEAFSEIMKYLGVTNE